MTVLISAEI